LKKGRIWKDYPLPSKSGVEENILALEEGGVSCLGVSPIFSPSKKRRSCLLYPSFIRERAKERISSFPLEKRKN